MTTIDPAIIEANAKLYRGLGYDQAVRSLIRAVGCTRAEATSALASYFRRKHGGASGGSAEGGAPALAPPVDPKSAPKPTPAPKPKGRKPRAQVLEDRASWQAAMEVVLRSHAREVEGLRDRIAVLEAGIARLQSLEISRLEAKAKNEVSRGG